jgi:hypothetical protein
MLHPYMPPETEYFLADGVLKAIGNGHGHYHNGHAEHRGRRGQPDNKPGKRFLPVKGDAFCYETGYAQTCSF